ncbi:MAG: PKD domain-containing protein [Ginsengibacter sp.]
MNFSKLFVFLLVVITGVLVADNVFSQIEFIENKGQWDPKVKFMSNVGSGAFFLQKTGFTVVQHNQQDLDRLIEKTHGIKDTLQHRSAHPGIVNSHVYNVEFVNANPSPEILPDKESSSVNNYFIGSDKSKWAVNCKLYKGVTYKNIYPGIDVRYYVDGAGRLKYDLIVKPGADVKNIALKYAGVDKLKLKNKELIINTSVGENKELYPYTYQVIGNERKELNCKYVIEGDVVKFKVNDYSPDAPLIIDPTQVFFTYSGSTSDNWGYTATYGPDGSFFSGGIVFGTGFKVSPGAYKETYNGGKFDIAVMKLTPDGKQRVYATFIGGDGEEQPHSLIVDPQGNLIIAGITRAGSNGVLNYPTFPVTVPKVYGGGGDWDIIVTKLNAAGNGIIGSMAIGGSGADGVNVRFKQDATGTDTLNRNYGDDSRSEVILDAAGNIYVASCSRSSNFKTTPGVFQPSYKGDQDAVVLKLNPNATSVIWSSYLGGARMDAAYVLALGNNNNIYVAGGTASTDMPAISPSGVISSTNSGGQCDGYVAEITNNGSSVLRGTYLGTNAADQVYGIQTDKVGNVYVMGTTEGAWPVQNAAFVNPNSSQFISKMKPDLSSYIYSTTFGSGSSLPNISPTAFLVDRCENVYVSGWGGKANTKEGYNSGTTQGMPVTPDAIKPVTDPSGSDFYFFVLKKDAVSQLYGTFFGQQDPVNGNNPQTFGDHVDGGTSRFDKFGVIYQAMCANCGRSVNFLGTPGSWSTSNQASAGGSCNLGMLKIEMNFAGVVAGPRASINGVSDSTGCIPLTVDFADTLLKGKSYVWDFGDGSPKVTTNDFNISYTYTKTGFYKVMLVAIDSSTCNIADTAYIHIRAGNNKAALNFIANKLPPCTNLTYLFDNTSTSSGNFGPQSFTWDFGDGSSKVITGLQSVNHTYGGAGTYKVSLTLEDTSFCNSPDDTVKFIRLSPKLTAQFNTPLNGCVPYTAVFENTSLGGLNFLWDFGDGSAPSALDNPTHLYSVAGNYTVKLYAFDSTSCNTIDSALKIISVKSIPIAAFIFSPIVPVENTFTQFTNQSVGATNYSWNFGDGDSSNQVSPRHIFPATGIYNVCLNVQNEAGCPADTCQPVSALINPLIDVPSAFTPGKFGVNSIVKVKGFGITQMHWKIYNRWGQNVFESASQDLGWDGTFKGKIQPIDVYAYTLDVVFSDGKKFRKTGDITLLR